MDLGLTGDITGRGLLGFQGNATGNVVVNFSGTSFPSPLVQAQATVSGRSPLSLSVIGSAANSDYTFSRADITYVYISQ